MEELVLETSMTLNENVESSFANLKKNKYFEGLISNDISTYLHFIYIYFYTLIIK